MLRIYSLSNFHVYHTTLLSILISYIPSNYLSYNWKFLSLDHLFPILPPVTPTFDSNKSYLSLSFFFMNLVLFIFVDITCLSSHPSVAFPCHGDTVSQHGVYVSIVAASVDTLTSSAQRSPFCHILYNFCYVLPF